MSAITRIGTAIMPVSGQDRALERSVGPDGNRFRMVERH